MIKENTDKSKIYCVNCEEYGHSASYRGCPFLKFVQKHENTLKQNRQEIRNQKIVKITNFTRQDKTYAQAIENNNNSAPGFNYSASNAFTEPLINDFSLNSSIEKLKQDLISTIYYQFTILEKKL